MSLRILVVDDASFIREMVKKQLRDKIPGLELNEAADGARALALIKQWNPDLVLSDWEMPNLTGEELLQKIRASDNPKLPFIMITSRGDRDHVIKAVQAGVSDYITKPFTPEELLRKVAKQLNALGKLPSKPQAHAKSQGVFSSVDLLTNQRPDTPKSVANSSSLGALQTNPLLTKKEFPLAPVVSPKGKAQLRFPQNIVYPCVIREMSLMLMTCSIDRGEKLPALFDQAVVDIETEDGGSLARINGYVHALQANENRPDAKTIKLIIRFVDDDPSKFEVLSKFIAN